MRPVFGLTLAAVALGCMSSKDSLTQQQPTLTGIVLTPDSVAVAPAGTRQFSVTGTWSDGSSAAPTVTYTATGGTISAAGLYTAGATPGTYRVIAEQAGGSLADTSVVTIGTSLPPPTLTALVLSPDTVTLAPAATQPFTVSGTWSDGSTTAPTATYTATGGTITTGGLYTAGSTTGTFRVIARQQGGTLADTSIVTIASGGGGGGPTVLFEEKFEDANLAARGWYDLPGAVTTIIKTDHIPGDTASLEIDFPQGETVPSPAVGGRHLFTASDAVYLRYWVKYSTNWVGSGQTYQPHEFLFITNLDDQYVSPAFNHLTAYIEHNYRSNGAVAVLESQDAANIDQARANQDLTSITENRAVSGCNGNADSSAYTCYQDGTTWVNGKAWQSAGPVFLPNPGTGYKNNWNEVEAYFKLNSIVNGIGQPDGVVQYWFNGQLVIDRRHVYLRTGAHPTMKFNQFLMLPYIGDGSPAAQKMWLNDLVVMTAKP